MAKRVLLPNFAAEEGSNWKVVFRLPIQKTIASLWRLVFDSETEFVDSRLDDDFSLAKSVIGSFVSRGDLLSREVRGQETGAQQQNQPEQEIGAGSLGTTRRGVSFQDPAFGCLQEYEGLLPWLSTGDAMQEASRRGLTYCAADPQVVRAVHDKAFAVHASRELKLEADAIAGLPTVLAPSDLEDVDSALQLIERTLRSWPVEYAEQFTLKPRFGSSGRGRVPGSVKNLRNEELKGSLKRLADRGGAILEPWFQRVDDSSVQFHIAKDGSVQCLGSLRQLSSVSGSYFGHRGVIDSAGKIQSHSEQDGAIRSAATRVAELAAQQGYWGFCGIDAFSFRAPDGVVLLRPCVEFNARFTFGSIVIGILHRFGNLIKDFCGASRSDVHFAFVMEPKRWNLALAGESASSNEVLTIPLGTGPILMVSNSESALDHRIGR